MDRCSSDRPRPMGGHSFVPLPFLVVPLIASPCNRSASSLPLSTTIRLTYSAIDSPVYPDAMRAQRIASSVIRTGMFLRSFAIERSGATNTDMVPPRLEVDGIRYPPANHY